MHYSPGFGDGTPGGVRAGKPTKKNWPRKITPRHPNHSIQRMQQDYLDQDDVYIVQKEIGRWKPLFRCLQSKSRGGSGRGFTPT